MIKRILSYVCVFFIFMISFFFISYGYTAVTQYGYNIFGTCLIVFGLMMIVYTVEGIVNE